jgi:hypothetical protein
MKYSSTLLSDYYFLFLLFILRVLYSTVLVPSKIAYEYDTRYTLCIVYSVVLEYSTVCSVFRGTVQVHYSRTSSQ